VVMLAGCLFATRQSKRDVGYQHNGNMTDEISDLT